MAAPPSHFTFLVACVSLLLYGGVLGNQRVHVQRELAEHHRVRLHQGRVSGEVNVVAGPRQLGKGGFNHL